MFFYHSVRLDLEAWDSSQTLSSSLFISGICTIWAWMSTILLKSPVDPVGTFKSFWALLLSIALEVLLRKLWVLRPIQLLVLLVDIAMTLPQLYIWYIFIYLINKYSSLLKQISQDVYIQIMILLVFPVFFFQFGTPRWGRFSPACRSCAPSENRFFFQIYIFGDHVGKGGREMCQSSSFSPCFLMF